MESPLAEPSIAPIRKSIVVSRPAAEAFRIFTEQIGAWWPLATHSVLGEQARSCHFEARRGGQLYEAGADGQRHTWGSIRVWDPPRRLVFSWHPGRAPDTAQEVEVRFEAAEAGTRVELEHRGWPALGAGAAQARKDYDEGWEPVLARFVSRCGSAANP